MLFWWLWDVVIISGFSAFVVWCVVGLVAYWFGGVVLVVCFCWSWLRV